MTKEVAAFIAALAQERIGHDTLRSVYVDINRMSWFEFERRVRDVEDVLFGKGSPKRVVSRRETRHEPGATRISPTTIDDVVTLLRDEAGMSAREAAATLQQALSIQKFPLRVKESLERYVARLSKRVEPRELLMVATRIRNDRVHHRPSTWTVEDV